MIRYVFVHKARCGSVKSASVRLARVLKIVHAMYKAMDKLTVTKEIRPPTQSEFEHVVCIDAEFGNIFRMS